MKHTFCYALTVYCILIAGTSHCEAFTEPQQSSAGEKERYEATDSIRDIVSDNLVGLKKIVVIDHSRLAAKEGVMMPPSTVTIYSHPSTNTALMKLNPRVGLDLPQKVLVAEESGKLSVVYPGSEFLARRHEITDSAALRDYDKAIQLGLQHIPKELLSEVGGEGVTPNYGIVELTSAFPHKESIARIKSAVMKQGDTVWFGEIDLHREAAAEGEELPPATLLLFGGPKPGGVAMAEFPRLGLDAFCQKLLVYESEDGTVEVIFNDIVAMSKLHYGKSAKSHKVINGRLTQTFDNAISGQGE